MATGNASADVVKDLAPTGVLRAAVNVGNAVLAQRDAATGELRGVSVDLARELGKRLGVETRFVSFDNAGKLFAGIDTWDVASLADDPARAEQILFTTPYVEIEATYLVRDDTPFKNAADVDRSGVRIAVPKGSALDLYLTREIKTAKLEPRPNAEDTYAAFANEGIEAVAGVRDVLEGFAKRAPGQRVVQGRFMAIPQAMGTLQGRKAGGAYLRAFVEEMKRSGFVAESLGRSGQRGVVPD